MTEVALGDALELIIDHRGKTPKKLGGDFTGFGVPVVSAIHIKDGIIQWSERERYVSPQMFAKWMPQRLQKGDVLLTSEAPLGQTALVPSDDDLVLSQRLFALRGKKGVLDSAYLRYFLASDVGQRRLHDRATGTTVVGIRQSELMKVLIPLPSFDEQRRIAGVLGSLDDLIEVNRKLIRDLVDTVDAAFMHAFGARSLTLPVGELAKVVDCLHSKKPEQVASGKLYLQLNNVLDNGLLSLDSTFLIDPADYQKWTRNLEAREWDCVITNVGRVGAVARIPAKVRAALGRNMTGIRPTMPDVDGAFIATALRSSPVRKEIALKTDSGTILDALNVKNIAGLRLPTSDVAERRAFQDMASPMLRASDELLREIRDLKATRDELLPLLMTGRVRVGDVAA